MDYEDARDTGPEAETNQLVSEIAAAAAAAAKAGGVPLLPDAQNVVILPAGATLDDIRVSGRDLVIQLDDGRIFVIPDGAVFVPQIVVDGVTVPPLNLAALLIGQQPQPAAGAVQSSGGNFADPVGPIQDAFDLGNLLPYTELAFPEQPDREVLEVPGNNTPTTIIITPNNPAGAVAASATVNEKGLPPHGALPAGSGEIADGNPSNNSDTTETTTGTIDITSLDGIRTITLNGTAITTVGQTIAGTSGTLTITSIDLTAQTVGYGYTLTNSTLGDNTSDNFAVTVTDSDGDTASATLMVNIVDDVPTARNDTDALAAGTFGPETGNVITGVGTTSAPGGVDTPGADGATLTRIASNNVPANVDTSFDGAGNLVVNGQYGVLSIKADGSYSYTRNANTPGGVNDVFSYTLTDGDTDTSTATLTIAIGDAPPAITDLTPRANGGDVLVDEDDLSDGSDATKESLTATGTFTIASPDGIASLVVDGRTVIGNGTFTATSWTTPLGNTMAITGYNPATGVVTYTYTLLDNESHPSAAGENSLFEDFAVTLTDLDGDAASSTLSINIIDDVSTARNDTDTVPTSGTTATGNVITGADTTSGNAGADTLGADGAAVTGFRAGTSGNFAASGATVTGQFGTLTLGANGSYTYTRNSNAGNGSTDIFSYQITDGDGDTSIATLTITIPDRPATVTSVPTTGGGTVVNESGLPPIGPNPAGTGEIADGDPNNNSNVSEITNGTISFSTPDGFGSLTINGIVITGPGQVITTPKGTFTVTGFNTTTGTLTYNFVLTDNTSGDTTTEVLTVKVTDSDGDSDTKPFTITIIDDVPIAVNDSYTQTAENADVTGNVTGNDTPGADGPAAGGPVALVAGSLNGTGQLTLNPNGTFTYKPGPGELGPVTFQYTYTDGDNDSDPALVTITLVADSVPVGGRTSASVDDDGLSGATGTGNPASTTDDLTVPNGDGDNNEATFGGTLAFTPSGDIPMVLSFAGMNGLTGSVGAETVTYSWNAGTNTLTATGPRGALFTVQITDVNTGTYKVTLLDNVLHADGPNNENAVDPATQLTYTIKDSDSPAVTGTLTITFDDDAPSATAEASQNVAEGATINGTFDFVQGADGAGLTHIGVTALVFDPADANFSQAVALGTLGTIKVKADGTYQFTAANPVNNPQTVTGTFTVTDGDGDTAQAGFSFVITDANVPLGGQTSASVDDDGLSGATGTGNPASTTDDLTVPNGDGDANEATFGGTLTFTPSADVPNVLSFAGMNGLTGSVGTETVTYSWNSGTNTLTATGPRGALFTVEITDVNTGTYKVTLLDNVLHAGGPNNENAVDPATQLTYTITDSDSPAVTGTLTITFDDDAPSANAGTAGLDTLVLDESAAGTDTTGGAAPLGLASTTAGFADNFASVAYGADGAGSVAYALLLSANGIASGLFALDTTDILVDGDGYGQGAEITLSQTVPGGTITGSAGGLDYFTIAINPSTGVVTFTQLRNVWHANAGTGAAHDDAAALATAAASNIQVRQTVTDADGDSATATVDIGRNVFSIQDDGPRANPDTDTVVSGSLTATGNVITDTAAGDAGDLDSGADPAGTDGGLLVSGLVSINVPGNIDNDPAGAFVVAGQYGSLTVQTNGDYVYTRNANSPGGVTDRFTYTVKDGDGDTTTSTLEIAIANTTPAGGNASVTLDDDDVTGAGGLLGGPGDLAAAGPTGPLPDPAQGDAPLTYSFAGAVAPAGFTYVISATQILIQQGGNTVVTVTFNATTGVYSVTQNAPVLHETLDGLAGDNTENSVVFSLAYTITDADLQTAPGTLTITVNDDTPIVSTAALSGAVDEDGLPGGIEGGAGDILGTALVATGSVTSLFQAGADGPLTYGLTTAPAGLPALTSGGVAVTYAIAGNTLTASAGAGNTVFTFQLLANGNYTFTLVKQLDHPTSNTEDNLAITLGAMIQATDKDGDTVTAGAGGLTISVNDDLPQGNTGSQSGTVDEDGLANGIAGGTGDATGEATTASGNVSGLFQSGADQPLTYQLLNNTAGLPALTSGGVVVTYVVAGNVLTASAGANTVFTLTLNGTSGAWDFALLKPLDHAAGANENDIVIQFGALLQATDKDGDTAAPGGPLTITIDDDTPIATAALLTGTVDEDGLPGGIPGGTGDVAGEAVVATGSVTTLFQSGADTPPTYSLAAAPTGLPALTSGGVVVTYAVAGNTLTASAGVGNTVFTFQLLANGNYTFTLVKQLDHPTANTEDNLTIALGAMIQATDRDNDTVTAAGNGLVITVNDDLPAANTGTTSGTVDEEGFPGGTNGGPGDAAGNSTTASGSVTGLFQSGADQPLTYQLLNSTGGLPSLTSGGVAVTYAVAGNVLTASAGANTVFTLTLNGTTGAWSFALLKPLDHAATGVGLDAPGQENDIVINFGALLQATDRDGDTSPAGGPLTITIDDDTPTVSGGAGTAPALLDETAGTGGAAVIVTSSPKGDDPDVAGSGAIAKATTASPIFAGTSVYGADGAGTLTYALTVTSALSGLLVSDGTAGGSAINLFNEGGVIVGRVMAGTFTGQAAFAISINATTGIVSVEQYLSIRHPVTTNPDDQVSLAAGSLGASLTVTDRDGDPVTSSVADVSSLFRFDDDGPAITSVTTPLPIANSGAVSATGAFVIATGADGQGVGNDTIKTVTFNATVNGNAVTSPTITQVSEDANTAVFNISFVYNNSPTTTVTETGTLTFNKAAGTYTVDLADPIQGFSISQTATGSLFQGYQLGSSTTDNTQPAVAVTQITPNLFIQYTGVDGASTTANYNLVTPATGDGVGGTFANGELFNATASWVSVSNTANGVAGDTIGGDEILNFNLYNTNPTGVVGTPTANADAMFLKFDGIGNAEDFIVVLKLYNPTTGAYTTKALMVENNANPALSDIQKGPGTGPGVYSGITLDNNDGLVIIESNDYNSAGENWKIVGAQIIVDPLAITGTAINFNNTTGAGGASSGTQAFSADINTGAPMKISSIGFVTNTTTAQTAQLTFVVTVQDGDGDTVQQTLVANVTPVVLDLDGDGAEFLSRSAGVAFDYLGDGNPLSTAWAGKDDGILAIDLNGNGKVDGGKEIVFGGIGLTDLEGIAAKYDNNHDGVLDTRDADFGRFGVWQDANSNGISDAGEFRSLADMGIASIDLTSNGKVYAAANGDVTVHGETSFTYADGSSGIAADASFAVSGADGDLMSSLLNLGAASADGEAPKTIGDLPPVLAALGESQDSNFIDNLVESLSGGTSGSGTGGDASDDALASLLAAHVAPDHATGAAPFDMSQFTAHDEAMAAAAV